MNKKHVELEDFRMPADEFDKLMRQALGVPQSSEHPTAKPSEKPEPKTAVHKKDEG